MTATPALAQRNARAKPPAEPPLAMCACGDFSELQRELAQAIALKEKFEAKARALREQYGDQPHAEKLVAARRDYEAFMAEQAAGQSSEKFTPLGQILMAAYVKDNRNSADNLKGIPAAVKSTADGATEPDLALRKRIEEKFRKAGKDLCGRAGDAAAPSTPENKAVCGGIKAGASAHENFQAANCRRTGYYAYADRPPAQAADDEAKAYQAKIDALKAEMERVAKGRSVKAENQPASDDPHRLLNLKISCTPALAVSGQIDDLKLADEVCDATVPFTIKTTPNANLRLTPVDAKSGTYAYRGNIAGATFFGSGSYTFNLGGDGGTLTLDGAGRWHAQTPMGTFSKGGPETLKVQMLPKGCS
ncbi:MAG: hypothetical protein ACRCTD_02375 [Beijerinckiaceae bacterium]